MRKQWLGWVLGVIAIATSLIVWNWTTQFRSQLQVPDATASAASSAATASPIAAPTVNAERLLADVKALDYVRYTERDRTRARDYIVQSLQNAGWNPQLLPFEHEGRNGLVKGANIIAERPGTRADTDAILVAGHYDTVERSPGADDNATAVATVLETARVLGQQATPRPLRLALFDLEEIGLVGSTAFVEQQQQTENLRGAIIMDMLGYTCETAGCQTYPEALPIQPPSDRGNFLAVIGDMGHPFLIDSFTQSSTQSSTQRSTQRSIQSAHTHLPPVFSLAIPTMGQFTPDFVRSDHAPFWRNGFGAVLITDTANFRNPHYHQPSDRPATLNPDFFVGSAQLVIDAATTLLQGE